MSSFDTVHAPLAAQCDLSSAEAGELMRWLIGGEAEESQILVILNALCDKGVNQAELVAFAKVMREKATILGHPFEDLVDTCGTGGGRPTFNISTAAAFVAAGAGARIAKHGNRSTTGLGSADVLSQLGVQLGGSSAELLHALEAVGIAFFFAPAHHPAMRHVASARQALGRRSVFNLLGPLANPAGAPRQLIGIYDPGFLDLVAGAVQELGIERAVLVHSDDGLDEISPCAGTEARILWEGELRSARFVPEDFGISRLQFGQIGPGTDIEESGRFLIESISDVDSPKASAVVPSAAVAIWLAGLEPDLKASAERAKGAIRNGAARVKLTQLIEAGLPIE